MNCIICQDDTSEPIHDNNYCECKYKIHNSCWIDYVNSQKQLKCMICRKDISSQTKCKPISNNESQLAINIPVAPYSSLSSTSGIRITPEQLSEMIIISVISNQSQNQNVSTLISPVIQSSNLNTITNFQNNSTNIITNQTNTTCYEFMVKNRKYFGILIICIILIFILASIVYIS